MDGPDHALPKMEKYIHIYIYLYIDATQEAFLFYLFPLLGPSIPIVYTARKAFLTAAGDRDRERGERERIMRTPMFLLLSLTFLNRLVLESGAEASTTGNESNPNLSFTSPFSNASDLVTILLLKWVPFLLQFSFRTLGKTLIFSCQMDNAFSETSSNRSVELSRMKIKIPFDYFSTCPDGRCLFCDFIKVYWGGCLWNSCLCLPFDLQMGMQFSLRRGIWLRRWWREETSLELSHTRFGSPQKESYLQLTLLIVTLFGLLHHYPNVWFLSLLVLVFGFGIGWWSFQQLGFLTCFCL